MKIKSFCIRKYEHLCEWTRRKLFNLRYRFDVMSMEQTVEHIRSTGCSIARFGDGEFGLIIGSRKPSFQEENEKLADRLREVSVSRDPGILICIPHNFKTTDDCNEFARKFWDWWIWDNHNLEKVAKNLKLSPWRRHLFGDAQITRPYMDWKDKSKAGDRFRNLASLWENRNVVVIEGNQTKIGVGNDLLEKAKTVRRILCPSKNAFNCYDKILKEAEKYDKKVLFLLALGPTATVLAYDLARDGYQALDIGHIDIEYEWFLQGATSKTAIPGKYTQEAHVDTDDSIENEDYLSQIVMRIK